ncbi:MAG TPA: methyltransferase domain-containing protein [Burkholderiaceae bacterium]|jgi:SAM-dependent methyltransferase|nr:methyltransferase domain-containing protein [Burkholderiaceae bacterium]
MNLQALMKAGGSMVRWRELRVTVAHCPICNARRLFIRLKDYEIAARCLACRASAVSLSIVSVLRQLAPDLHAMDTYELSSRGPLYRYLKTRARTLTASEYFDDVAPGEFHNGIQCQDVQRLTHDDARFDLCTSTEVFEHVPEDAKAFSEVFRVLRPNGLLVFTVPIHDGPRTLERAVLTSTGEVRHLLPPQYHGDPLRSGRILAFRTYGQDVTERLQHAGFIDVKIVLPVDRIPWGYARPVVVAFKAGLVAPPLPRARPLE